MRISAELGLLIFRQLALANPVGKSLLDGGLDHALEPAKLFVTFQGQLIVGLVVVVEGAQREAEQRQRVLSRHVLQQGLGELRVDLERLGFHQRRRPFDDLPVGAFKHLVEREGVLGQGGEHGVVLDLREGVRTHGEERKKVGDRLQASCSGCR